MSSDVVVQLPLTQLLRLAREAGREGAEQAVQALSRQHGNVLDLVERTGAHKDVMNTREAADYCGVEPDTVRKWISKEGLPTNKVAGQTGHQINRVELDAWRMTRKRKAA